MSDGTEAGATSSKEENDLHGPTEARSLLDVAIILAKNKVLVLGIPAVSTLIALVVSFLLPVWFSATTRILPPQQSQSSALAILGQLGGLGIGASQVLGLKNPSDTYVSMLRSQTVADRLIERFNLKRIYDEELLFYARKELANNSSITSSRDGIIAIEVEDRDPKRAADIANAYVEELRSVTAHLAIGEASQRRLFFEGQLKNAKNDLTNAEADFAKFSLHAGIVNPPGQLALSISAAGTLRGHIVAKEIQLSAMRIFATSNNPEMQLALQELNGLRAELAKLESDSNAAKGDILVPFAKAPEIGLEYVRKYRDIKYYETLYEVLSKQYEIARIDEAKEATLIQVLDTALPPEKKSRPRRLVIVVLTLIASLLVAPPIALARERFRDAKRSPSTSARLSELKSYLSRGIGSR